MKRRIATFAGSVVICLAVAAFFLMRGKGLTAGWCTSRPTVIGAGITREAGLILVWSPLRADDNPVGRPTRVEQFGFTLMIWPLVTGRTVVAIVLPWWLVQGSMVVLCVAAYLPMKRHIHRIRGCLCLHCGYDIRSTPDRCPECGSISGPLPP